MGQPDSGVAIRNHPIEAIESDLTGPFHPDGHVDGGPTEHVLPLPPSRWYLTGFLAPEGDLETTDPVSDDEPGGGNDQDDDEFAGRFRHAGAPREVP